MPTSAINIAAKSATPETSIARRVIDYAPSIRRNVGLMERLVSTSLGGCLMSYGLTGKKVDPICLALSGFLLYRGVSGSCPLSQAFAAAAGSLNEATVIPAREGVRVEHAITIDRPAAPLYQYWRNLSLLPRFMDHVKEVRTQGKHSHWVARGPLGLRIEWDAEIINDVRNELIAWRSLPGSDVDTAGSVHFTPVAGGAGTEVRVNLKYDLPAGKVGTALAKLFGVDPREQLKEDLMRFKRLMEAGHPTGAERAKTSSH